MSNAALQALAGTTPRCAAGGKAACPAAAVAELLLLFNYRGRVAIRWVPRCARHLASWDLDRIRPLRVRERPA